MIKVDAKKLPVMVSHCKTCPFRVTESGRMFDTALASDVIARTLFQGHQICHTTEGPNREPHNRCKGAFDYNLSVYKRLKLDHLVE